MDSSVSGFHHSVYGIFFTEEHKTHLANLLIDAISQINILIGPNNSGKSQVLRGLLGTNIEYYPRCSFGNPGVAYRTVIKHSYERFKKANPRISMVDIEKILDQNEIEFRKHFFLEKFLPGADSPANFETAHNSLVDKLRRNLPGTSNPVIAFAQKFKNDFRAPNLRLNYLPILRSVRRFPEISNNSDVKDPYSKLTSIEYDISTALITTGYGLYDDLVDYLLGNHKKREQIKLYESFLSDRFFNGKNITLIPSKEKKTVTIKIGEDDDREIHNLGDGLQTIIILTFFPWITINPTVFCIEEPETSLHPGLQRALIRALSAPEFERHTFFMTTHSNHFLDLQLEQENISIYKTRRAENKAITLEKFSSTDASIITDLGVRPSSVLLTNLAIFVEGITDRLYLQIYFRKYLEIRNELKEVIEGKDYSFIEYQGSNITHWNFSSEDNDGKMKSTNFFQHIFLIADGDTIDKGNRKALFESIPEENRHIIKGKEIENLIPESTLKLCYSDQPWKEKIMESSYINKKRPGLGGYLDNLSGYPGEYSAGGQGTVKNKLEFCKKICQILEDQEASEIITGERMEICGKIYRLVRDQLDG